jgi:hypothetical protein
MAALPVLDAKAIHGQNDGNFRSRSKFQAGRCHSMQARDSVMPQAVALKEGGSEWPK